MRQIFQMLYILGFGITLTKAFSFVKKKKEKEKDQLVGYKQITAVKLYIAINKEAATPLASQEVLCSQ